MIVKPEDPSSLEAKLPGYQFIVGDAVYIRRTHDGYPIYIARDVIYAGDDGGTYLRGHLVHERDTQEVFFIREGPDWDYFLKTGLKNVPSLQGLNPFQLAGVSNDATALLYGAVPEHRRQRG